MTRRTFVITQALATAAFGGARSVSASETSNVSEVAITMDDFNLSQAWPDTATRVNRQLLDLFDRWGVRITMFVTARNVEGENGRRLLQDWSSAGHCIANHTYSHFVINSPQHSLADFQANLLKAERILESIKNYQRMFRFPALKEGNTVELRDGMRSFLDAHHYRNGYVTVDASDWYYSERLRSELHSKRAFRIERFKAPYVDHIRDRSLYYDGLARHVLGRSPRHTLLVHYSFLNARFLGAILRMYQGMGWRLVNSDHAFADPVFKSRPNILPAGESLIWALAKESGRYERHLRYPGEDGAYEKPKLDALDL